MSQSKTRSAALCALFLTLSLTCTTGVECDVVMSPAPVAVVNGEMVIAPEDRTDDQSPAEPTPAAVDPNPAVAPEASPAIMDVIATEAPADPPADDPPPDIMAVRSGPVFSGRLSGLSHELVDGRLEGHFPDTATLTVRLDDDLNLTGIDIPGLAQLPTLQVDLAPVGEPRTYSGEPEGDPFESYSITVTFRTIQFSAEGATLIADMDVRAAGGSLTVTGSAIHEVDLTWGERAMGYEGVTTYDVLMSAVAPDVPGVALTVVQELEFSGALVRQ